jgi:hypothetical protein
MEFLEKKRGKFPRLFFLSNEELIEIFGKGNMLVQSIEEDESKSFIGNIFEGVDRVIFAPIQEDLSHMVSKDGEEVHLYREVPTKNYPVDKWLARFEERMKETVKLSTFHAFEHMDQRWIDTTKQTKEQDFEECMSTWSGQGLFLASQIWYTMRADAIFQSYEIRERQAKLAGDDAPPVKDPTQDDESKEPTEPSQKDEEEEEEENEYEEKVIVDPETADWNAYYD